MKRRCFRIAAGRRGKIRDSSWKENMRGQQLARVRDGLLEIFRTYFKIILIYVVHIVENWDKQYIWYILMFPAEVKRGTHDHGLRIDQGDQKKKRDQIDQIRKPHWNHCKTNFVLLIHMITRLVKLQLLEKSPSCKLIPNLTRNRMITYTKYIRYM